MAAPGCQVAQANPADARRVRMRMQPPNAPGNRPRQLRTVRRRVATALIPAIIAAVAILAVLLTSVEPAAAQSADATLSGITVDGASVAGFASDRLSYQFGVPHDTAQVTIAATATDSGADVSYFEDDADPVAAGLQVDLRAGQNPVTIQVISADNMNTMNYTVFVNRGVVTSYGWKASDDLDVLIGAGNAMPFGIWSDKTNFWVSDVEDGKLYAYHKLTKERVPASDIDLDSGNADHTGIWSNRTTMWVADSADRKLYAYNLSTNTRVSSEDFNTLIAAGNEAPGGIWSDGETMWVVDAADTKIYAYNVGTKARDSDKDFDLHSDNANPSGIWSDRETMWVSDTTDNKIYAYSFSDGMRDSAKDFNTLALAGNETPNGIWSDSLTMWVADTANGKAYSYNMLRTNNATLSSITVDGNSVEGFAAGRDTYNVGVAHDTTQVTIAATSTESTSTMAFSTIDADDTAPGHQVDLDAGRNGVNITVTAVNMFTTHDLHRLRQPGRTGRLSAGRPWTTSTPSSGPATPTPTAPGATAQPSGSRIRRTENSTPTASPPARATPPKTSTSTPATTRPRTSGPTARPSGWLTPPTRSCSPTRCRAA